MYGYMIYYLYVLLKVSFILHSVIDLKCQNTWQRKITACVNHLDFVIVSEFYLQPKMYAQSCG